MDTGQTDCILRLVNDAAESAWLGLQNVSDDSHHPEFHFSDDEDSPIEPIASFTLRSKGHDLIVVVAYSEEGP